MSYLFRSEFYPTMIFFIYNYQFFNVSTTDATQYLLFLLIQQEFKNKTISLYSLLLFFFHLQH